MTSLQEKIDRMFSGAYYNVERPHIDKAIQELREEIKSLDSPDLVNVSAVIRAVLALIGGLESNRMTETLQQKIDYFTITAKQMNSDYNWSSIEPQVNKAIQELREAVEAISPYDNDELSGVYMRRKVLALIGEKK